MSQNSNAISDELVQKWVVHLDNKTMTKDQIRQRWGVGASTLRKRVKEYREKQESR
jgi:transposase